MSLREIQEMEAKEQEAQKAAEWEWSHAPATGTVAVSEDSQTFTVSWGLPMSQVGTKSLAKDMPGVIVPSAPASMSASVTLLSPTNPLSAPPVAVWMNTQKPATKKSMRGAMVSMVSLLLPVSSHLPLCRTYRNMPRLPTVC